MDILQLIREPWPWYVGGPLIGLTVPALLLLGNKSFGISSSLRHICAACFPADISYFRYNWKRDIWNLFFVVGILVGGFIAARLLKGSQPAPINEHLVNELNQYGIHSLSGLLPPEIFNWRNLFTLQGLIMMVCGGFFVGFGTRYAGGCTSGHSITGLSNLQWPSLVATICFMVGGFLMSNLLMPFILTL